MIVSILMAAAISHGNGVTQSTIAPADWQPPIQYQHGTDVMLHFRDTPTINKFCTGHASSNFWSACQTRSGVNMENPCGKEWEHDTYALAQCHEIGHWNGWGGDHAGGHWGKYKLAGTENRMAEPVKKPEKPTTTFETSDTIGQPYYWITSTPTDTLSLSIPARGEERLVTLGPSIKCDIEKLGDEQVYECKGPSPDGSKHDIHVVLSGEKK